MTIAEDKGLKGVKGFKGLKVSKGIKGLKGIKGFKGFKVQESLVLRLAEFIRLTSSSLPEDTECALKRALRREKALNALNALNAFNQKQKTRNQKQPLSTFQQAKRDRRIADPFCLDLEKRIRDYSRLEPQA